jgi:hypothetical protein
MTLVVSRLRRLSGSKGHYDFGFRDTQYAWRSMATVEENLRERNRSAWNVIVANERGASSIPQVSRRDDWLGWRLFKSAQRGTPYWQSSSRRSNLSATRTCR